MLRRLVFLAAVALLPGCATIIKGTTQSIYVSTSPEGASCDLVREGMTIATVNPTPGSAHIEKTRQDITVECEKSGYENNQGFLPSELEGAVFGNILAGGLIGVGIDNASGAVNHYPEQISIALTPKVSSGVGTAPSAATSLSAQAADQAERAYWGAIENSTSPDGYRAYLDAYPNGQFRVAAEERLQAAMTAQQPLSKMGTNNAELLFWQSIEDSQNPADFSAYLETYPNGTFAPLARVRAGLKPGGEVVPEAERRRIETYFKQHDGDMRAKLRGYNERNDIAQSASVYKVTRILSLEVLSASDKKTSVKIGFAVGRGAFKYIYEMQWVANRLQFVGHQKIKEGAYRAYLDAYPNGQFRVAAEERLQAALSAQQPLSKMGTNNAELLFWQSIKDSQNPADFGAYLETYPNGTFAPLAHVRAGLKPVGVEVPEAEQRRIETYFKQHHGDIRAKLRGYNEHNQIGEDTVYAGGAYKIERIISLEVLSADDKKALVKLLFSVGRRRAVFKFIYEMQWVANRLQFVGHQEIKEGA